MTVSTQLGFLKNTKGKVGRLSFFVGEHHLASNTSLRSRRRLLTGGHAQCVPLTEGMMASSAARCSSRWITVVVSSGPRRAVGTVVSSGHGGARSISTLATGKIWGGGSLVCGEAWKALTLRGLSGEWCVSHIILAQARLANEVWGYLSDALLNNWMIITSNIAKMRVGEEMSLCYWCCRSDGHCTQK